MLDQAFVLGSASSLLAMLGTHLGSLHLSHKKKKGIQSPLIFIVHDASAV